MDDVDGILILSLKQVGCKVDAASFAEFQAADVVACSATALQIIDKDMVFNKTLPQGVGAQNRLCNSLANACKRLGYRGQVGFDTFMLPTEKTTRELFMWMVEKLPTQTEDDGAAAEALSGTDATNSMIHARLSQLHDAFWSPANLRKPARITGNNVLGVKHFSSSSLHAPGSSSSEQARYHRIHMPKVTAQPPRRRQIAPSLLNHTRKQLVKQTEAEALGGGVDGDQREYAKNVAALKAKVGKITAQALRAALSSSSAKSSNSLNDILAASAARAKNTNASLFANTSDFVNKQDDDTTTSSSEGPAESAEDKEEQLRRQREEEINSLESELQELKDNTAQFLKEIETFKASLRNIEDQWNVEEARQPKLEAEYTLLKEVFDKLPEADKYMAELQELNQAAAEDLLNMAEEWEQRREPAIAEYRNQRKAAENKQKDWKRMVGEVKGMREQIKQYLEDIHEREDRYKKLYAAYEPMPKDVNRATYTRKIHEIVKNVRKQKLAIDQILSDWRELQKDINTLGETLGRVYHETEDYVFTIAKQDPSATAIYKGITKLHQHFADVIDAVEATGQAEIQCRNLQAQIEAVESRMSSLNSERLVSDLKQIKKENEGLMAKLHR